MGAGTLQNPEELAVRLVTIDSYMTDPHPDFDATYSHFQRKACQQVPVVRIFGATPEGKKACVHIHQAFPHFYVPVDPEFQQDGESAASFGLRLAVAIESAMQATTPMQHQHIYSWSITRAVPFYGYHPFPQFFVKIQLFRPDELSRIATILQSGGILGRRLQPYESHIPFLLQVMVERNLVGMGMVRFRRASPRPPLKGCSSSSGSEAHSSSARRGGLFGPDSDLNSRGGRQWGMPWDGPRSGAALALRPLDRTSLCELEVDALLDDILNGADVVKTPLQHAGEDIRMVPSLAPIWEDETQRTGAVPPVPQLSTGFQRCPAPLSDHDVALRTAVYELARLEGLVPPTAAAGTPPESTAGPQATPLDRTRPSQPAGADRGSPQPGLAASEAPVCEQASEALARGQGGAHLLLEGPLRAQAQEQAVCGASPLPSGPGGERYEAPGYTMDGQAEQAASAAEQETRQGTQQGAEGALDEELLNLLSWIAEEGEDQGGPSSQGLSLPREAFGVPRGSPWRSGGLGRGEEELPFEGGAEGDPEVLSQREAAWAVAAANGVPKVALERARERFEECSQREWEQIADCVEDLVQEWETSNAAGRGADIAPARDSLAAAETFHTVAIGAGSGDQRAPGGVFTALVRSEGGSDPAAEEDSHGERLGGRHSAQEPATRVIPQVDGAFDSSQGSQSAGEGEGRDEGEGEEASRMPGQEGVIAEAASDRGRGKRIRIEGATSSRQTSEYAGGRHQPAAVDEGTSGNSSSAHSEEVLPGMPAGARVQGAAKVENGSQPRAETGPPILLLPQRVLMSSTSQPGQPIRLPLQMATCGTPRGRRRSGGVKEEQGATSSGPTLQQDCAARASVAQGGGARGEHSSGLVGSGAHAAGRAGRRAGKSPERREPGANAGRSGRGSGGGGKVGAARASAKGLLEAGTSVRDLMRMRRLRKRLGSSRSGEPASDRGQQADSGATRCGSAVPGREAAEGSVGAGAVSGSGLSGAPRAYRSSSNAVPGRVAGGASLANGSSSRAVSVRVPAGASAANVTSAHGPPAPGGAGPAPGAGSSGRRGGGGMQSGRQGAGLADTGGVGPESPHTPLDHFSCPRSPSTASALSAPASVPVCVPLHVAQISRAQELEEPAHGRHLLVQAEAAAEAAGGWPQVQGVDGGGVVVKEEVEGADEWGLLVKEEVEGVDANGTTQEGKVRGRGEAGEATWKQEGELPLVPEDRRRGVHHEGAPWNPDSRAVKVESQDGAQWLPEEREREEMRQEVAATAGIDRTWDAGTVDGVPLVPEERGIHAVREEVAPASHFERTVGAGTLDGAPAASKDRSTGGHEGEGEADRMEGTPVPPPTKDGSTGKGDGLVQSPPADAPVSSSRGAAEEDQGVACVALAAYDSERAGGSLQAATVQLVYHRPPPSAEQVHRTWPEYGMEEVQWRAAHYSNAKDLPERPVIFGGKRFDVRLLDRTTLQPFDFGSAGPRSAAVRTLNVMQQQQQARERKALRGQAPASEQQHQRHIQQQQQQQQGSWELGNGEHGQRGAFEQGEAAQANATFGSPVPGLVYRMSAQGRVTYELSPSKPPPLYGDVRRWVRRNPKPYTSQPLQPFAWRQVGGRRSKWTVGEGGQQDKGLGRSGEGNDAGGGLESTPRRVPESQAHLRRDLLPEARRFLEAPGWSSGDFGDDTYEDLRGTGLRQGGGGEGGERGSGREGAMEEGGEDEEAEREWRDARPSSPKFDESYLFFTPPVAPRYTRAKPGHASPGPRGSRVRRRSGLRDHHMTGPEGEGGRTRQPPESPAPSLSTPQGKSPLGAPSSIHLGTPQGRSPLSPSNAPPGTSSLGKKQASSPLSPPGVALPLGPRENGNKQAESPEVKGGTVTEEHNPSFLSPEAGKSQAAASPGVPAEASGARKINEASRSVVGGGPSRVDSDDKQQMPPPSNYKRKPLTSPPPFSPPPFSGPPASGAPPDPATAPAHVARDKVLPGKGNSSGGDGTPRSVTAEGGGGQESGKAIEPASKAAKQAKKEGASAAAAKAAAAAARAAAVAAAAGAKRQRKDMSQITPPKALKVDATPLSQAGIKYKQKHSGTQASAAQHLTILSIETHACSRGQLRPDPQQDAVSLVAMAIQGARAPSRCAQGAPEEKGTLQGKEEGDPQAQGHSTASCGRESIILAVNSGPTPTSSFGAPSLGPSTGPSPALGLFDTSGHTLAPTAGSRLAGEENGMPAGASGMVRGEGALLVGEGQLEGSGCRTEQAHQGGNGAPGMQGSADRAGRVVQGCKVALPGGTKVHWVDSEETLFTELVRIVRCLDPDIVTGWDIQAESLGYLAERALRLGQGSLLKALSRTPSRSVLRTHGLFSCLRCASRDQMGAAKGPEPERRGGRGKEREGGGEGPGLETEGGPGGLQVLGGGRDGEGTERKGQGLDNEPAQPHMSDEGTPVAHRGRASASAPDETSREAVDPGLSLLLSPGLTPDFPALSPSPLASQGADARQAVGCTQGGSQDFLRSFAAVGAEAQALLAAQGAAGVQQRGPQQQQQHPGNLFAGGGPGMPPSGDLKAGATLDTVSGNRPKDGGAQWGAQKKGEGVGVGGSGASTGAPQPRQGRGSRQEAVVSDEWGRTQGSGLYVEGRIVLNLWRIFKSEIKLPIYTFESVAEAVLLRQVPKYDWPTLSAWYARGGTPGRWRCMAHFASRGQLCLEMMEQLDFASRTAELARVFGIDFFSVINRGSQFRVESMMMRLAHTQGYLLLSPSRMQVSTQPAMECIPLVMEPESALYTDPVVVLDFQSLYPSLVIAYNLCFSTCLGRLSRANPKKLGVSLYHTPPGAFSQLKDDLLLLPNGVMYVPPAVRKGVLPRLLNEILTTRVMVKQAMKKVAAKASNRVVHRVLNARQLALKLIANVTYGYTAAGFSGRMPCAELADSIVQAGRVTLERAIALVNNHPAWRARVVYGDTDSLFVLLKGRSREEAFRIGGEIVEEVSRANPPPVTLKLEKVYQPCILQTKKRYVGYAYESPLQATPTFDAKGIETVRRDSCPVVAKTLESCLRILFETQDLSLVKAHIVRQWQRILSNRAPLRDFIFAKEVRLGSYSVNAATLPPAAVVASKAMARDPRAEPKYGERVPYVVVYRDPGARLVDMVVDPLEILEQAPELRLHGAYYITKQVIPALHRVFALVGAEVASWLAEMPRAHRPLPSKRVNPLRAAPLHRRGFAPETPLVHQGSATTAAAGAQSAVGTGAAGGMWEGGSASSVPHSAKGAAGRGRGGRAGSRGGAKGGGTIDQYYASKHCAVCGTLTRGSAASSDVPPAYRQHTPLCPSCARCPELVVLVLQSRASKLTRDLLHLNAICHHCGSCASPTANPSLGGRAGNASAVPLQVACVSLNCPVFFERKKVCAELQAANVFDY